MTLAEKQVETRLDFHWCQGFTEGTQRLLTHAITLRFSSRDGRK